MSDSNCLFCRITSHEIPARIVAEDEQAMAFLDINPFERGHTLVVPKYHAATLLEMPEERLARLMPFVQRVAKHLVERLGADGFNLLQNNGRCASQTIDHLHFHIIPRWNSRPINWESPRVAPSAEDLDALLAEVKL